MMQKISAGLLLAVLLAASMGSLDATRAVLADSPSASTLPSLDSSPGSAPAPSKKQYCANGAMLNYTSFYGNSSINNNRFGPGLCTPGAYVTEVVLTQDATQRLTGINMTCSQPGLDSPIHAMGQKGNSSIGGPQYVASLSSPTGFSYVKGSTATQEIVSSVAFYATDGAYIYLGSNNGYYSDAKTQSFSFDIPPNSTVVGMGGRKSQYIDELYIAYCPPATTSSESKESLAG